jgi:hypothetical protein
MAGASAHATIVDDWTFDGTNGQTSNMPEAVSGTNTLTASGSGSVSTTGAIVGTGFFSRPAQSTNSDVLTMSAGTINPPSQYTITAWIKTTQTTFPNIMSWTKPSTGGNFAAEFRLNAGTLETDLFNGTPPTQFVDGTSAINDGQWHMVAVTRDFSAGKTSLFVDSAFQVSDGTGISGAQFTGVPTYIAGNTFNSSTDYAFNGSLDDVSLWNERLTLTDLKAMDGLVLSGPDYNAKDAGALFTLFTNGGTATVEGRSWAKVSGLSGSAGTVESLGGSNYAVVLDGSGNGVETVPEPATAALFAACGSVLLFFHRGWLRREGNTARVLNTQPRVPALRTEHCVLSTQVTGRAHDLTPNLTSPTLPPPCPRLRERKSSAAPRLPSTG